MCEGPSKKRLNSILLIIAIAIAIVSIGATTDVAAQGSNGRSSSARRPVSSSPKRARVRSLRVRAVRPIPMPAASETGRLSIVVNEPGSRVYLSLIDADQAVDLISVSAGSPSLIVRTLSVGEYKISVKKSGFFDEVRVVNLLPRARRKIVISLRPQMAMLSLRSNLADAEFEIENAGRFNSPLKKYLIKPGIYKISIRRRGFISQTVTADLKIAGKEQSIYVVLQPLRIDAMLARANELIAKAALDEAAELVHDVLLQNSSHAKANLLYGMIELRRGSRASSTYFLKAIQGGETVTLPVKALFLAEFADVELSLDRNAIILKSRSHADLNFRITRPKLDESARFVDANLVAYVALKGRSDFFGRSIHPDLKIFAGPAKIDITDQKAFCRRTLESNSCTSEIDIIFKVITDWREMSPEAVKRS